MQNYCFFPIYANLLAKIHATSAIFGLFQYVSCRPLAALHLSIIIHTAIQAQNIKNDNISGNISRHCSTLFGVTYP